MKYKLFILCIILFSLNNIILGNLSITEKTHTDSITINKEIDTKKFSLEINNEISMLKQI